MRLHVRLVGFAFLISVGFTGISYAQDAESLGQLSVLAERGELQGQIIERTPGRYLLIPQDRALPVVQILNPDRVAPASVGVPLTFNANIEAGRNGVVLNGYSIGGALSSNPGVPGPDGSDASPRSSAVSDVLSRFRFLVNDALRPVSIFSQRGTLSVDPAPMNTDVILFDDRSPIILAAEGATRELNILYGSALASGTSGLADRNAAVRGLATIRLETKSIYGTVDNYPPWSYDQISKNARSVVAIAEPGQTQQAICSGVLIAPDLVLTAGHCFKHDAPENLEVWFDFAEADPQTLLTPKSFPISGLVAPPPSLREEFLDRATEDRFNKDMPDFAIVRIDISNAESGPEASALPQCLRKQHIRRGRAIYVIGYPRGTRETVHDNARIYLPFQVRQRDFNMLKQEIEADFVILPDEERIRLMGEFVASYVPRQDGASTVFELFDSRWGDQPKVGIVADLFRGNSGSPVFDRNNHCIVGIHTGGVADVGLRLGASWQTHETVLPIPSILAQLEKHDSTRTLVDSGVLNFQ